MELQLTHGDYVSDGAGGVRHVAGNEALLQRVLFRLTARRGAFPFCESLGSQLWKLGQVPAAKRQSAAKQYVAEALAEETGVQVERVELVETGCTATLEVDLLYGNETLTATLDIQL